MVQDVSKKTLVVLVFIIILVTIIGTWAVLNTGTQSIVRTSSQAKGVVMLQLVGDSPQPPSSDSITGNIVLNLAG